MPINMRFGATPGSAEIRPTATAILSMNRALRAAGLTAHVMSLVKLEDVPGLKLDNAIFWFTPDGTGIMIEHGLRMQTGSAGAAHIRLLITPERFSEAQRATLEDILAANRPGRETRQTIRRPS